MPTAQVQFLHWLRLPGLFNLFPHLSHGVPQVKPPPVDFLMKGSPMVCWDYGDFTIQNKSQANVIAPFARATVNFRLHPAHTLDQLLQQIQHTISDERVKIEVLQHYPSLPMSSYDDTSFGYQVIKGTIQNVFPEVAIAPGLCIANTDTRHYQRLTKELYRFIPMILKQEDLTRLHGVNERISVKNYEEIVKFYFRLLQNSDLSSLPSFRIPSCDL